MNTWKPHTETEREFAEEFTALTEHWPFRWQWRLFDHFQRAEWPRGIDLPTGCGKTSVIALWVLALARSLKTTSAPAIPRRLVYVVDRRVVVDQASEEAEKVADRLAGPLGTGPDGPLGEVATALRAAGCDEQVLAISALRGQRTRDERWRVDPSRPAIIVGTVDMVGSRLLFSAFGKVGPWGKPYEAGMLGQDSLVVLDEAHLSRAFDRTLSGVESVVAKTKTIRPFAVIRMGATIELASKGALRFVLEKEDRHSPVLERLTARKHVELHNLPEDASVADDLAGWAIAQADRESGASVGLILNTVRDVRAAADGLRKKSNRDDQVLVLTGSMRGVERDEIVGARSNSQEALLYRRFRAGRQRAAEVDPAFLVATSCVEVGADIDLDHLGTEVCALDSLVQRLGRVNRLGERKDSPSRVRIVVGRPKKGKREQDGSMVPADHVAEWLRAVPQHHPSLVLDGRFLDGCPDGLPRAAADEMSESRERRAQLCGAPPPVPVLGQSTVDDFSMTSLGRKEADRPDVSLWLRGCAPDDEGTYVELAWREELGWISDPDEAASLVEAFPVAPRETARCPLTEAVDLIGRVRARVPDKCLVVVRDGDATAYPVSALPEAEADLFRLAAWSQVVLPCSAGGYRGHVVQPEATGNVTDVADQALPETWAPRRRLWLRDGALCLTPSKEAVGDPVPDADLAEDVDELLVACEQPARALLDRNGHGGGWSLLAAGGSGGRGVLVARQRKKAIIEGAEGDRCSLGFGTPVPLMRHLDDAGRWAEALCDRLGLDEPFRAAVAEAARSHDLGKERPWWQRAIGNPQGPPLAKSGRSGFDHAVNAGYRHELGSLFDLLRRGPIDDLVGHLVTAHHGHGRPGFRPDAEGPIRRSTTPHVVAGAIVRFARLQQQYGAWQLAYLEALVKAADALASREAEQ